MADNFYGEIILSNLRVEIAIYSLHKFIIKRVAKMMNGFSQLIANYLTSSHAWLLATSVRIINFLSLFIIFLATIFSLHIETKRITFHKLFKQAPDFFVSLRLNYEDEKVNWLQNDFESLSLSLLSWGRFAAKLLFQMRFEPFKRLLPYSSSFFNPFNFFPVKNYLWA